MANHLERLTFVDEIGIKANIAKTTGWAPCGQRLVDHAPFGHWRTQTFVAALRHDRLDAPWVIDGAMNVEMFDLGGADEKLDCRGDSSCILTKSG